MSIPDQFPRRMSRPGELPAAAGGAAAAAARGSLTTARQINRDQAAALAGLAAALALAAVLIPFRASFPNTDAALALVLVVVAVAAAGRRLAEAGGLLQGRFLLTPGLPTRPTLEQRLVAIGLADEAAAALAGVRLAGLR